MAGCLVSEVTDRLTGRVVARPWLNGDKLTQTVKLADWLYCGENGWLSIMVFILFFSP